MVTKDVQMPNIQKVEESELPSANVQQVHSSPTILVQVDNQCGTGRLLGNSCLDSADCPLPVLEEDCKPARGPGEALMDSQVAFEVAKTTAARSPSAERFRQLCLNLGCWAGD